jgi:hypothetical protein
MPATIMLRHESQWFGSVCRLLLLRVFLRVFVKTELNKITLFQVVTGLVRYRPGRVSYLPCRNTHGTISRCAATTCRFFRRSKHGPWQLKFFPKRSIRCGYSLQKGDRPGPEGIAEHGAEGAEVGRDFVRVRACGPAASEAGTMGSRTRRVAGGECGQVRS